MELLLSLYLPMSSRIGTQVSILDVSVVKTLSLLRYLASLSDQFLMTKIYTIFFKLRNKLDAKM